MQPQQWGFLFLCNAICPITSFFGLLVGTATSGALSVGFCSCPSPSQSCEQFLLCPRVFCGVLQFWWCNLFFAVAEATVGVHWWVLCVTSRTRWEKPAWCVEARLLAAGAELARGRKALGLFQDGCWRKRIGALADFEQELQGRRGSVSGRELC